ncbi:hypothetical protein PybrP1_012092 [[Pythium] brassicae (nom. inval.)]|nr:hypothetical protein PybrP1_012092 [[Pythium] brassicae (nom. inval.)]
MDPFGDSDSGDLSSFQAPVDPAAYSNDFYEVDSGEAAAAAAGGADQFGFDGEHSQSYASYSEQTVTATSTSRTASFEQHQTLSGSRHSSFNASGSRTSSKFMRGYEQQIAEKAVEQEKVAHASKDKAKADMDKFAAERVRIKESKQQANRVHEQATLEKLAADLEAENPWERVVSLVDLEANRKQKLAALNAKKDAKAKEPEALKPAKKEDGEDEDVTRMRQLFVQLKAEPLEKTRGIATH